jgi:osmotically-inducible protein OsmY
MTHMTLFKKTLMSVTYVGVAGIYPFTALAANKAVTHHKIHQVSTTPPQVHQAENQAMTAYETELVRKIRSSLSEDNELSTQAKNVVITSNNGKVLLQGSVPSRGEQRKIVDIAKLHSGAMSVIDQTVIHR